jgi:hypothetical protein
MAHVEMYLPDGTTVTVSRTGGPINYTTTKDVTVPEVVRQTCPLNLMSRTYSGNWLRDCTLTVGTVQMWYAQRSIRRRIVVPQSDVTADTYSHPLTKIDYDIPTALGAGYALRIAGEFHRLAVRCSKSTWVIRTGDIPYNLLAVMEEDACTINADPIDPSATKKLIARAIVALQEQVESYIQGANETLQSSLDKLQNSTDDDGAEAEVVRKCLNEAKAMEKRIQKYKDTMVPGASRLGITDGAWNPNRMIAAARITADSMRQRAAAYRRGTQALAASTDSTAQALAASAANNTLPPEVMGDALREAGEEELADAINETFSLVGTGTDD